MSCVYGKSDEFRLVDSDDVNGGLFPTFPIRDVGIFPVIGHTCKDAYTALMTKLNQDVLYAHHRQDFAFEMPVFIVLCHTWELDNPHMVIPQYSQPFVEIRDITMGLPLAQNYYLYITDPPAIGMSNTLTQEDLLNSPLRNAGRVTYIQQVMP
jgi:hypothetical protein